MGFLRIFVCEQGHSTLIHGVESRAKYVTQARIPGLVVDGGFA